MVYNALFLVTLRALLYELLGPFLYRPNFEIACTFFSDGAKQHNYHISSVLTYFPQFVLVC